MSNDAVRAKVFLLSFIITIVLLADVGGQVKRCADFGEYCQNHWDCCSNTCMSYLYRCTRNYAIYPYTFLGNPQPSTLEEILALNFGTNEIRIRATNVVPEAFHQRFGDFEEETVGGEQSTMVESEVLDKVTAPAVATMTIITEITEINEKKLPNNIGTVPTTTTTTEITKNNINDNDVTTTAAAIIRTNAQGSRSSTATPTTKCNKIGEKCYSNEDCCEMRCHGFLHQCVT